MASLESSFSELDELYREIILDHYRRPRNARRLDAPTIAAEGNNPFCGDESAVQVALDDEGRVVEVGVKGVGCSISQASGSLMSDLLRGKTVGEMAEIAEVFRKMMQGHPLTAEERGQIRDAEVLEGVRRFPVRVKCALLAWMTLREGLERYRSQGVQQ